MDVFKKGPLMDRRDQRWQKLNSAVGSCILVAVIWAGNMAASFPGRVDSLEKNQMLLAYRMEQLENAVRDQRQDAKQLAKN